MYLSYQDKINQVNLGLIHLIENKLLPDWDEESKREIHQRIQAIWEYPELNPEFFANTGQASLKDADAVYFGYSFNTVIENDGKEVPSVLEAGVFLMNHHYNDFKDGLADAYRPKLAEQIIDTLSEHIVTFRLAQKEAPMRLTSGIVDMLRHLEMRQYQVVFVLHDMSNADVHEMRLRYAMPDGYYVQVQFRIKF